jgi:hypothetical protein
VYTNNTHPARSTPSSLYTKAPGTSDDLSSVIVGYINASVSFTPNLARHSIVNSVYARTTAINAIELALNASFGFFKYGNKIRSISKPANAKVPDVIPESILLIGVVNIGFIFEKSLFGSGTINDIKPTSIIAGVTASKNLAIGSTPDLARNIASNSSSNIICYKGVLLSRNTFIVSANILVSSPAKTTK